MYSFSIFARVCFLFTSIPSTLEETTLEVAVSIKSVLRVFKDCHVKFISVVHGNTSFSDIIEELADLLEHTKYGYSPQTLEVFSLDIPGGFRTRSNIQYYIDLRENWTQVHSRHPRRFDIFNKFRNCLVHIYITHHSTMHDLHRVTTWMQGKQEWPHHLLVVDNLDRYDNTSRMEFYQNYLPLSFARGLILVVDLDASKIWMKCIPCAWYSRYEGYRYAILQI